MSSKSHGATGRRSAAKGREDPPQVLNDMFGSKDALKKSFSVSLRQPDVVHDANAGEGSEEEAEANRSGERGRQETVVRGTAEPPPVQAPPATPRGEVQEAPAAAQAPVAVPTSPSPAAAPTAPTAPLTAESAVGEESATATATTARSQAAPSVNITVNLFKPQVQRLNRIAALEQIRLDRKVSASEILRHLIDFALAHVEDDVVLLDNAGCGLQLPGDR